MPDIGFAQSLWLWLLPLAFIWLHVRSRQKNNWPTLLPTPSIRYPSLSQTAQKNNVETGHQYHPKNDRLAFVAIVFFILSLAQPVSYLDTVNNPNKTEPVDLVLLVDTSLTMVLKDYVINKKPTDRMSMARRLLKDFIADYSGSRIGLSIMGNPPLHWLPYTPDKDIIIDAITRLRTTLGGRLTDMSASLKLVADDYTSEDDKVVVMITDGGLQLGESSPQEAASRLFEQGYSLYVLAIGSTQIDQANIDTTGFIYEPVDLTLLEEIARLGNGQLFHAIDSAAFSKALQTIENRHRKVVETPPDEIKRVKSWYPLPMILGIFLLLYSVISGQIVLPTRGKS